MLHLVIGSHYDIFGFVHAYMASKSHGICKRDLMTVTFTRNLDAFRNLLFDAGWMSLLASAIFSCHRPLKERLASLWRKNNEAIASSLLPLWDITNYTFEQTSNSKYRSVW